MEPEIAAWVDLCDERGVRAEALGWSRRPLHRCRVDGPWGRRKRWHYWAVSSAREVVAITFADLDYVGLAVAMVIDRATGETVRDVAVRPMGWNAPLPEVADRGRVEVAHRGTKLALVDRGAHVSLVARTPRIAVDVAVTRPPGHESLGVAVEWPGTGGRRFAYTSKQAGLPATGTVAVDGAARAIAPGALACLDWGRGVWPARTAWNWASAADARTSFNLGAQWTHGTTENAVVVAGQLTKIAAPVRFVWDRKHPRGTWNLSGDGVDLALAPEVVQDARLPGGGGICIAFGAFRGTIAGVEVRDLFGWAEELHVLW